MTPPRMRIPLGVGHLVGLGPLGLLAWQYSRGPLGPDPIREAVLRTGRYALVLLLLSLVPGALRTLGRRRSRRLLWLQPLRAVWGLWSFGYVMLHVYILFGLDYGFDLPLLTRDVLSKRYALAGLASFLLLLPLAVTSTRGWTRRLGRHWRRLHRLVFVAAGLAVLHYAWTVKVATAWPYLATGTLAVLVAMRVLAWQANRR
jgi:methionine sulfoxide reductase heme-binding subunit